MVRKLPTLIISILFTLLIARCSYCETAGTRARLLNQLTQTARTQIAARTPAIVESSPMEASQLELDLIFYRYAAFLLDKPADVKNISLIIPALSRELNDETVSWASEYFSINNSDKVVAPMPAREDERVEQLSNLNIQFKSMLAYRNSSPIEAVNALLEAVNICQKLYLDISEAFLLKELGDHYQYHMTRYRLAEVCYDRAAWTFLSYGCIASSAIVYDDWGSLNIATGKHSNAIENYIQSARQWGQLAKEEDPTGYKYRDLAGREYMRAGIAQAAANPEKALELMTSHGLVQLRAWAHSAKSYDELIKNLITVAELYRARKNTTKSIELLEEAKRACEVQKDPLLTAAVYKQLSLTYSASKLTPKAQEASRKRELVLSNAASAGENAVNKLEKSPALSIESKLKLYVTAEKGALAYKDLINYPKSVAVFRMLANVYANANMNDQRIQCLRSLAAVLDLQKKPEESLAARREAVMLAMKSNQKGLAAAIGQTMVQVLIDVGNLQNALEGFTDLAQIMESSGDVRGAARILDGRGTLLASDKYAQYEDAITNFQDARTMYTKQVGDIWAAAEVSRKLASAQIKAGKAADAQTTLETVLDELETKFSSENLDPGADPIKNRLIMNIYQNLITAYINNAGEDKATNLTRKAKRYPWISELINQLKNDNNPVISQFAEKVDILGGLKPDSGSIDIPGTSKLLADTWAGFPELCQRLEQHYQPIYSVLPIDPLSLFKVRSSLPNDITVVAYMPVESATYMFVCSNNKAICREVNITRSSIESLIGTLRKTLNGCEDSMMAGIPIPQIKDWQEPSFLEIKEPLIGLYSLLISPIKEDLVNTQRLVFILPNEFAGLPVHALISSEQNKIPKFMLEDYQISYLASGTLDDLISVESKPINQISDRLAIFADPEGNLPGAQKEADNIRNFYFNSKRYVRETATTANFLRECSTANIIHIAAHHRIDTTPGAFQLILAPDRNSDGSIGITQLSSITNPRLGLVVLSACDSIGSSDPISSGPSYTAEMFSLVGAKSVLGGLWKVSDEASYKVMSEFYRGLSRNMSRTEALRRAQQAVIESKDFAHPFFWACFALYGNPR